MWRRRRWRLLLNLIDHLPRNSHFVDAQAADEELALLLAAHPEPPASPPRWSEYSPEYDALLTVIDRLGDLTATVIAVNSKNGRAPKVPRARRPQSAVRRLRDQQRLDRHRRLVEQLLPDKAIDTDD